MIPTNPQLTYDEIIQIFANYGFRHKLSIGKLIPDFCNSLYKIIINIESKENEKELYSSLGYKYYNLSKNENFEVFFKNINIKSNIKDEYKGLLTSEIIQ